MFKKLFVKWLFEIVGAILVLALAFGIIFGVNLLTKTEYLHVLSISEKIDKLETQAIKFLH